VLGKAIIDQNRCIPWVEGKDCGVCEEVCPIPGKAITLKGGGGGSGQKAGTRRPQVVESSCIGCGLCETQCPVNGVSAIRVYPVGYDPGIQPIH
jgi:NAD-dependent dihydropyrimidine dehydrogenase PreA subunit